MGGRPGVQTSQEDVPDSSDTTADGIDMADATVSGTTDSMDTSTGATE